jgi:hypothetical protein
MAEVGVSCGLPKGSWGCSPNTSTQAWTPGPLASLIPLLTGGLGSPSSPWPGSYSVATHLLLANILTLAARWILILGPPQASLQCFSFLSLVGFRVTQQN